MFSSFLRIRYRRRSSGPSKLSSLTGKASSDGSKSCGGSITFEASGGGACRRPRSDSRCVRNLDRVSHSSHRLLRNGPSVPGAFDEQLAHVTGPCEDHGAALADRIQQRIQRGGKLLLDLDVADSARPVARLKVV